MKVRMAVLLALVLVVASVTVVSAQAPAYQTQFITSITFQNVGTGPANVVFQFYPQNNATPITVQRPLAQGAGSSLYVGGLQGGESLGPNFLGSAVMSSNQPVVATLVQIPQSNTVKNRPLSNGFSNVTSRVLLATVLKNRFATNSRFSIQNADGSAVDLRVRLVPVPGSNPGNTIEVTRNNLPAGAAVYFDMGNLPQVTQAEFNGSALVEAFKAGTQTPANIVGSVVELSTNNVSATAFEGVSGGAKTVYMATALCDIFGGQRTSYAVQNVSSGTANVTVTYKPSDRTQQATIPAGAKASFVACDSGVGAGYTGAAVITSNEDIVVIGKLFGPQATAFLGEAQGNSKLALPYVRYTTDEKYNSGAEQRTNIAIQNVGAAPVGPVTVKYLDKNGGLVGTHVIPSIAPGAKANTRANLATGDAARLLQFGNPGGNPGGGYGGSALIEAPAGSQLIAVARVGSAVPDPALNDVAEDYNGIPVQ
jgi:hypothetical protein